MPRKNTKSRTDSAIAPTHRFAHRFSSAPERALSWAFQKTSSDVAPKYDSQKRADVVEDPLRLDVAELMLKDVWGESPEYPREDWQLEVADDSTNLGYWHWLSHRLDAEEGGENGEASEIEDPLRPDVVELMLKDIWGEYPQFPREDWRQEVADENTNFGYWQWLSSQLDEAEENEDGDPKTGTEPGGGLPF